MLVEAPQYNVRTQSASATVSPAGVCEDICTGRCLCLERGGVERRCGAPLSHAFPLEWSDVPAGLGEHLRYMRNAPTPEQWFLVSGEHLCSTFSK